jgi:NAD dependent epimerase/dehydratase
MHALALRSTTLSTMAVTGAEGFIGSHLVEGLVRRGHHVRAMVLYNSFNSWGWLESLPPDVIASVEVQLGDAREIVFHLAALIAIPYSYRSPRSYIETNVLGTMNVMEAVRQLGTPRVVHTSTSEVYGTAQSVPIAEDHPLQGQSPYSASKIGADKVAESYHLSFGVPVVTLRPFNVYGPRQSARAVIPSILSQLMAGEKRIHLGDLRPTRDFTYVVDTVRAFIMAGEAPNEAVEGQVLNAGSGSEISIGALFRLLCEVTGRQADVVEDEARLRPPLSEVMRLVCDSQRLREAVGWHPERELRDGLAETAAWFADPDNLGRYKWDRYNV